MNSEEIKRQIGRMEKKLSSLNLKADKLLQESEQHSVKCSKGAVLDRKYLKVYQEIQALMVRLSDLHQQLSIACSNYR